MDLSDVLANFLERTRLTLEVGDELHGYKVDEVRYRSPLNYAHPP